MPAALQRYGSPKNETAVYFLITEVKSQLNGIRISELNEESLLHVCVFIILPAPTLYRQRVFNVNRSIQEVDDPNI